MVPYEQMILPLVPNRVFRTYLGGRVLDELHGKPDPKDSHYPEEWIASTTVAVNPNPIPNEGLSRGYLPDGSTPYLKDLINQAALSFLGAQHIERFGAETDILVKFIDSAVRLQVQAHPLPAFSRRYLNCNKGKTEAWIVLQVRNEPGMGYVYLGFQHPPARKEWAAMIREQDTEAIGSCFERIYVQPGDVFIVQSAVPHAIGPGILMIEVQEPSDLVFRCEFACGGYQLPESSRFMNLDLKTVLDAFDYSQVSREEVAHRWQPVPELIMNSAGGAVDRIIGRDVTDKFVAYRITAQGPLNLENEQFSVCAVVEGRGLVGASGATLTVRPGSTFVIPTACEAWSVQPEQSPITIIMARR